MRPMHIYQPIIKKQHQSQYAKVAELLIVVDILLKAFWVLILVWPLKRG